VQEATEARGSNNNNNNKDSILFQKLPFKLVPSKLSNESFISASYE
jgi:hypothetical protein